jgi:hypothetical protein
MGTGYAMPARSLAASMAVFIALDAILTATVASFNLFRDTRFGIVTAPST